MNLTKFSYLNIFVGHPQKFIYMKFKHLNIFIHENFHYKVRNLVGKVNHKMNNGYSPYCKD